MESSQDWRLNPSFHATDHALMGSGEQALGAVAVARSSGNAIPPDNGVAELNRLPCVEGAIEGPGVPAAGRRAAEHVVVKNHADVRVDAGKRLL